MKKINSDKLCVNISVSCFIDADKVQMYCIETGEVKRYSEIEDEMEKWILFDEVQVMRDCDEIDHNKIEIVEA
jgi:hypothetical protein